MKNLVEQLNKAAEAYYNNKKESMSDKEYDELYDRLIKMERETGVILPNSPTQRAGFTVMDKLPKVKHEFPALSLDKTKDIAEFSKIFDVRDRKAILMWKADGSTVQLTYNNGVLVTAATRGNGEVGQDITHNAPYIKGIPMKIPYKGKLVVRGEAVMTYAEFNRINAELPDGVEPYKNPRNLANSTVSLLDSQEVSKRLVTFLAFNMVYKEDDMPTTFEGRLQQLNTNCFNLIPFAGCSIKELVSVMDHWGKALINVVPFPVDGLVIAANDAEYAEKQPGTGHNPHKLVGYALKWEDETVETVLREIEWSASRTGLLNPVAIFDPVELEGTTVSRASLHNVSYIKNLHLRVGDTITVYKANKIIPQVDKNLSTGDALTYNESHPVVCPVCGAETAPIIRSNTDGNVEVATCPNPDCAAKQIKKFVHFCERDCMNIEGLSEATLEKFVQKGWLKDFGDLYTLCDEHGKEIAMMEGMGEKSLKNLSEAIKTSRQTSFVPFIHALGIPNVGKGQAKLLEKAYTGDIMNFFKDVQSRHCFQGVEGIGEVIEESLWNWGNQYLGWIHFPMAEDGTKTPGLNREIESLLSYLTFENTYEAAGSALAGKTFVITGSLNHYENRDALVEVIEANGGKTSGSVSVKTSYLINNDVISTSSKNMKAQELGIPIISEEQFAQMLSKNII